MEEKQWRYDYRPGRTREELEEERILESLAQSPEERFASFMNLIRLGIKLQHAKAQDSNTEATE